MVGVLLMAATYRAVSGTPESIGDYDYDSWARVAVMDGGRVMPLDTMARNALMRLSGKQSLRHEGARMEAAAWLADVMSRPQVAQQYACFRVDNPGVIGTAGLRPEDGRKRKYFTYAQLRIHRNHLRTQATKAGKDKAKDRTPYQAALLQLEGNLRIYEALAWGQRPLVNLPAQGGSTWGALPEALLPGSSSWSLWTTVQQAKQRGLEGESLIHYFETQARRGQMSPMDWDHARLYTAHVSGEANWQATVRDLLKSEQASPGLALELEKKREVFAALDRDLSVWTVIDFYGRPAMSSEKGGWLELVAAYRAQDSAAFGAQLESRRQQQIASDVVDQRKINLEVAFNRLMPFMMSILLDVLAFLLTAVLLFFGPGHQGPWRRAVWRSVMVVLGLGLVVYTLGLGARMYLHGRPPVTNLYSSAVFMGVVRGGVVRRR